MSSFRRRLMMIQPNRKTYDNGIYIAYSDGTLKTVEEGDSINAVGVALVYNEIAFIIDKGNQSEEIAWSTQQIDLSLNNVQGSDGLKNDTNGLKNTDIIIAEDDQNVAASYCRSKSIIFGKQKYGYLGSSGEWQIVWDNLSLVQTALSKIGGDSFSQYNWTSTECDYYSAYHIHFDLYPGFGTVGGKTSAGSGARPFYSLY